MKEKVFDESGKEIGYIQSDRFEGKTYWESVCYISEMGHSMMTKKEAIEDVLDLHEENMQHILYGLKNHLYFRRATSAEIIQFTTDNGVNVRIEISPPPRR